MAYADVLKGPRWKEKRRRIIARDGGRCLECGSSRNLQVDHKKYDGMPWEVDNHFLQTLCDRCHIQITKLRRKLNDIVAEMNSVDLVRAIDQLGQFKRAVLRPLQVILEKCERDRVAILAQSYTPTLGRMLEEIDERTETIYSILQASARENFA